MGHGLQARLLGNWDDVYYRSGAGDAAVYSDPRFMLDFKAQYRVTRRYELFFDVMNLTNEFVSTFVLRDGMKFEALRAGISLTGGAKVSF